MTRAEIKDWMVAMINDSVDSILEDIDIIGEIDTEEIYDFLWKKDFGKEIIEEAVEAEKDSFIEDYLENVYEEIKSFDIKLPF